MSDLHINVPVTSSDPIAIDAGDSLQNAGWIFRTAARAETGGVAADGVYASGELYNPNAKGVRLFAVCANGSGTVALKVQVRNPYLDTWVDLTGAAIAAFNNGVKTLTIYPGLTGIADSADVTNNQHLGSAWRVVATVATATETFSVAADYLL